MNRYHLLLIILIIQITSLGCKEKEKYNFPLILTSKVSDITPNGAIFQGEIVNLGDHNIMDYGFVWDTINKPTIENSYVKSFGFTTSSSKFSAEVNSAFIERKTYFVRAFVKDEHNTIYSREVAFISLGGKAPIIDGFLPETASWGDTIMFIGENFSTRTKDNIINFSDFTTTAEESSESEVIAIVPKNLDVVVVDLSVIVVGNKVTIPNKFRLLPPQITGFTPQSGTYKTIVEINGENFHPLYTKVKFDTVLASLVSVEKEKILAEVPKNVKPGDVVISVTALSQEVISLKKFNSLTPYIESFSPTSGTFGDEITISGQNFNPTPEYNTVGFGNTIAQVLESSKTELKVKVPNDYLSENGKTKISVEIGEVSNISKDDFELLLHSFSSFTPDYGSRGDQITLAGQNFNPDTQYNKVYFGDVEATIITASPTKLIVSPANGVLHGSQKITVEVAGRRVFSNNDFMIYEAWRKMTNFSLSARVFAFGFSIGGKGYMGGGYDDLRKLKNDLWEYDPNLNTWTRKEDLPLGFHWPYSNAKCVSFTTTTMAYVLFGKRLWRYDPSKDNWNEMSNFPGDASTEQSAFIIGNKAFIGTGRYDLGLSRLAEFWEYDELTNNWSLVEDYGGGKISSGVGFSLGGKGFVGLGGWVNKDLWEYDPVHNQWFYKLSFSENMFLTSSSRVSAVGMSCNGKGYILTGSGQNDIYEYNPLTNECIELINIPSFGRFGAAGFSINNKIYIGTGSTGLLSGTVFNDFWEFDPLKLKPE